MLWFKYYDFRVNVEASKPFGLRPLITEKIAIEKNLDIKDLNFIYENTQSYELEESLIKKVEIFRRKNNLIINETYRKDVKKDQIIRYNKD